MRKKVGGNLMAELKKEIIKNVKINIPDLLQGIADEICNKYCKYPETWDEEVEGCELSESDICKNCPLNFLT